uniref:WH1 domain-containing protein n=1 Tax=Rhabditophanes sp. KR3021 TaxID=114890 RepID=A0AC35TLK6_9BILA
MIITLERPKIFGSILINEDENKQILNTIGKDSSCLAIGVAEILQPDFHLKEWSPIQSGIICFVKDIKKKTMFLNVYRILEESEKAHLTLQMEITKRLSLRKKTDHFITFTDSLDEKDFVGLNFSNVEEAGEFFARCFEIQRKRSDKFSFMTPRKISVTSINSHSSEGFYSHSSSSSTLSTPLADKNSRRRMGFKCDSKLLPDNSNSMQEEVEEFKDKLIQAARSITTPKESYSLTHANQVEANGVSPPAFKKSKAYRSSMRGLKKQGSSLKSISNARNSIKINKKTYHTRSTPSLVKTLKIQRKNSNTSDKEMSVNVQAQSFCSSSINLQSEPVIKTTNVVPTAPPIPHKTNRKSDTTEANQIKDIKIKEIIKKKPETLGLPEALMDQIKAIDIGKLNKVSDTQKANRKAHPREVLSVMDMLRFKIPRLRNGIDPESDSDDFSSADSAWSSS